MSAHNIQIKCLRSLPIHKSLICVDDPNDWGTVTYKLRPNHEFEMQILKLGKMVEVIKPQSFRDKIKAHIYDIDQMYN